MLDQIKDNKQGIVWHESEDLGNGTKALVRDARYVNPDVQAMKKDAGEKYGMQILNEVRAGIALIDKDENLTPAAKKLATDKLMHIANTCLEDIDSLPKKVKTYNTQLVDVLEKAGIKDVSKKLVFAKEMANFKDEHNHIVTLTHAVTEVDGKRVLHTVSEAEIMLNGLTPEQKAQYEAIARTTKDKPNTELPGMDWYNKMPPYKQDLLREVAGDIATGNKVIPTQLLSDVPGIKNAYQKVTAVKSPDERESTIISQTLHCGTPATKIKVANKAEQQTIVNEQVKQLQTFVPDGEKVNLNILTSKTPLDGRGENFVQKQLKETEQAVEGVKISASPINGWRRIGGGGTDHSEFKDTLKDIGTDLAKKEGTKNVGKFLKNGSSFLETLGEKLTFGAYKSTETLAKKEIEALKKTDPKLAKDLTQAMAARELIDSSVFFTTENTNLKLTAAMNIVENSVKLEHGALHKVLDPETRDQVSNRVDFCKSGKDRTGYVQMKNTHEAVSNYLGVDPKSDVGIENMLRQAAGGHTQEMAGVQGGSVGCHSMKTNFEFGLSGNDQMLDGIVNQKSSHYNSKVKVEEGKAKEKATKAFEQDFEANPQTGKKAQVKVEVEPKGKEQHPELEAQSMRQKLTTKDRSATVSGPPITPPTQTATRSRSNSSER